MSDNKMFQILIDGQVAIRKELKKVSEGLQTVNKRLNITVADFTRVK